MHTPGPWVCHSGMVWKVVKGQWPDGAEVGIPIARMDREPNNGTLPVERDENAKLIAAAPDLLTALEFAANWISQAQKNGCPAGVVAVPSKINDAITKATLPR